MTTKEVTKKTKKNELAPHMDLDEWGEAPITSQDITLPRILLMQPMSDLVTEGEAAFGDFIESVHEEKLGDFKNSLTVVPFYLQKVYVEFDVSNGDSHGDKKFLRMVPITAENDTLPYEDHEKTEEGKTIPIMRDRCMNYYVLVDGQPLPHVITFRRSSIKAGKKLATQMYIKNKDAGLPPPGVKCELFSGKETNDKGTYAVMDVKFKEKTSADEMKEALKWYKLIVAGEAKVHEESFDSERDVGATASSASNADEPEDF